MAFTRYDYPKSSLDNWNFRSLHMASDQGGRNTNPITPENFIIAAGPARLDQVGDSFTTKVAPIGMLESASVSQQKATQQVREIGSRRSYVISSYATGSLALSRLMYSQASLLRVLTMANDDFEDIDNPPGTGTVSAYAGDIAAATNSREFYINMQSELFDRPIGLLFYILDQRNQPYGAFYAEECAIQGHNFGLSAQGIAINESASMTFDRLLPVDVFATG